MKLGVFARTYDRSSVDEVFESAARDGFSCVQFNLTCSGLDTLPGAPVPEAINLQIQRAVRRHGVEIVAVSGTFNMAHPLAAIRHEGLRRLKNVILWAAAAKISVVTLCTGTRDAGDMWHHHPDNTSREAWDDMFETLAQALSVAEAFEVTLAIEPEPANVVANAPIARRLLDLAGSARLKIILDPANLARPDTPNGDLDGLSEAIDLLVAETVLVHAKDRRADGSVCPAGQGIVEFLPFLGRLRRAGYNGPVVVHGIEEAEIPKAVNYLRSTLDILSTESLSADY